MLDKTENLWYTMYVIKKERKIFMKIVLGILVMLIGLSVIHCNKKSNNPKVWLSIGGCAEIVLGLGYIISAI